MMSSERIPDRPPEFWWVKSGLPVWYHPAIGKGQRFAGRVAGDPYTIGGFGEDAIWVVRLVEMEPRYRDGARDTVSAACLGALEPRQETPREPKLGFKRGEHTFWLHTIGSNGHPYPTQEETTDEDLTAAILAMPEERRVKLMRYIDPDHVEAANRACSVLVRKLTEILDTGKQKGTFGGSELQDFAERLLELRGHPDPGFGVDPQDSSALCALRQACDDHLIWPSEAQREGGDYLAAIEHSGLLARLMARLYETYKGAFGLFKDKP